MSSFDDMVAKMKKAPLRRGGGDYLGEGLFEVEILSTIRKMAWNKAFTVRPLGPATNRRLTMAPAT